MIQFHSDLPPETLAKALAAIIYGDDFPVSVGVPFRPPEFARGGKEWWELSYGNDHKLYVYEAGSFAFIDRYNVPERLARARSVLTELGVVFNQTP